jgi:hypothetical protein
LTVDAGPASYNPSGEEKRMTETTPDLGVDRRAGADLQAARTFVTDYSEPYGAFAQVLRLAEASTVPLQEKRAPDWKGR